MSRFLRQQCERAKAGPWWVLGSERLSKKRKDWHVTFIFGWGYYCIILYWLVFFSLSIWGFCWFLSRNCNGWPIQRTGFLRRFWILQCQNPTRRRRFCWLRELKLRVSASPSITVDLFDQLVVDYLNNRSSRYPSIRVSILSSIQLGQLTVDTLADHCFGGSGYGIGRAIAWSLGRIFLKGLDHIPIN